MKIPHVKILKAEQTRQAVELWSDVLLKHGSIIIDRFFLIKKLFLTQLNRLKIEKYSLT